MLVYTNFQHHYDDALERVLNFNKFSDENDASSVFLNGVGTSYPCDNPIKEKFKNYNYKVHWNHEQPCAWLGADRDFVNYSADTGNYFDKIFTICPYSANWVNEIQKNNRFEKIWFPYNLEDAVQTEYEKEYDVLYWGGVHAPDHVSILNSMKNFKYNFLTLGTNHWCYDPGKYSTQENNEICNMITHINIPRADMWEIIRKTKILVISNMLYLDPQKIKNIMNIQHWDKNEANKALNYGVMPQLKTRPIEAAFNKCLMLVKRDPWNLIEHWYEPDKDFIYYDENSELESKINEIINDWDSYKIIVDNAYKKSINNYTTKHFFDKISLKER